MTYKKIKKPNLVNLSNHLNSISELKALLLLNRIELENKLPQ